MTDVVAGQVEIMFTGPPSAKAMAAGGKLKILGVGGKERLGLMPDVPTLDEAGVPGYELTGWFGMLAPAKTPQPVLDRLTQEVRKAVRDARFSEPITAQGLDIVGGSSAEMTALMRRIPKRLRSSTRPARGLRNNRRISMAEGLTGWRLHVGAIFPPPVPPAANTRMVRGGAGRHRYHHSFAHHPAVDGRQYGGGVAGMEQRAARQLATSTLMSSIGRAADARAERRASPINCRTGSSSVRCPHNRCLGRWWTRCTTSSFRTVAMATPFRQLINDRLVKYLAHEQITVLLNKALGIERNTEIRRLPLPVEYQTARKAFLSAEQARRHLHSLRGWGSMHNHRTAGAGPTPRSSPG
jgi:hypothetical protein